VTESEYFSFIMICVSRLLASVLGSFFPSGNRTFVMLKIWTQGWLSIYVYLEFFAYNKICNG